MGDADLSVILEITPCLADEASNWLERLLAGSISTREDLTTRFLAQFFPPGRTTNFRNDFFIFQQHQGESLSKAWTRFKDLLQKVPHHGIDLWLQVQIFYDHIDQTLKKTLDYAAEGKDLDYENPDIEQLLGVMEYKVDTLMKDAISLMGRSEGVFRMISNEMYQLPPEPSRQEEFEHIVMNFILDQEERVKHLEEYMRVIVDDFMQLSSKVTRRPPPVGMIRNIPLLYVNVMSKKFHNSIMKDKMVYNGNNVVGALMNVPIFVGTFSVVTNFAVLENMDAYRDEGIGDVIFGEPFLREVGIKTNRFEGMITIYNGDNEVTYQMVRSHPSYTQEEGIDYDEVFALVARIEAIRLFLAYASFMNFIVYQMEVKTAFLYGTIEEEVYVCQPPGFEDPEFPNKVYKVEKALYGLHQAPRA
ncbi:zinc finger, CCHC-type containing protein [Tanacetum coccineum]